MNERDAEIRRAALVEIVKGLQGPEVDRSFWRDKATTRINALEEDGEMFGLVPHEEYELKALKLLLKEYVA